MNGERKTDEDSVIDVLNMFELLWVVSGSFNWNQGETLAHETAGRTFAIVAMCLEADTGYM